MILEGRKAYSPIHSLEFFSSSQAREGAASRDSAFSLPWVEACWAHYCYVCNGVIREPASEGVCEDDMR